MKLDRLVLGLVLVTAACAKDNPATTPSNSTEDEAMVNPTVPSWAPKSCIAYHTAVVRFVGCEAMDAAARDTVKASYEADSQRWQEMSNLPQGAIADVGAKCTADGDAVRAQIGAGCPGTTTTPPAN